MLLAILIFYAVLGFYTQAHALVNSLNKTTDTLTIGSYDYLSVSVYSNESVTWTSSNPNVATVSSFEPASGCVKAVSAGTATITATTTGGNKLSCVVTVNDPVLVPYISLNKTTDTLTIGDYDYLSATVFSYEFVTWTSSNPNVAMVYSFGPVSGCVKAVSKGTTIITATTTGGNRLSCAVTVNDPVSVPSISLNKTTDTLTIGSYDYLSATIFPYEFVTWTSSNPNVAMVSYYGSTSGYSSGCIKAVSAGTATITATTAGGNTLSCVVTVNSQASNKTALNKAISSAQGTVDSLNEAISAAQAVLNNSSATQTDIDNAVTTLKQALQ